MIDKESIKTTTSIKPKKNERSQKRLTKTSITTITSTKKKKNKPIKNDSQRQVSQR
jgi:hypothetical protein